MSTGRAYDDGIGHGRDLALADLAAHGACDAHADELLAEAKYCGEHGTSRFTRAFNLGVARGYRAAIADQRPEDAIDGGAYEVRDPKHERHHEVMSDISDLKE